MERSLSLCSSGLEVLESHGPKDAAILGMAYDSREVRPGYAFFAFEGLHTDGHRYIEDAITRGASAVIHASPLREYTGSAAYLRVADPRLAMAPFSSEFYGRPSESMAIVGVTGTEGKSTTVYLIYQLLSALGVRAGFFSTVMSDSGSGPVPNPEHQTTPEAPAVQGMLAGMRDSGYTVAVIESSSHGLSEKLGRLARVAFDIGVMTNVTREHLEFHGTWERYRDDKANLFRALGAKRKPGVQAFGVVNEDDPSAAYFKAAARCPSLGFSAAGHPADARVLGSRTDDRGSDFFFSFAGKEYTARIDLPGSFNLGNALAAIIVAHGLTRRPIEDIVAYLPTLKPVRGRMTSVEKGQPFGVIVDYAHTPSSFEAVFPSFRERCTGKAICVFGSAGERDTEKRPRQGRLAADYFDVVILTDEDPRGEDPMALLKEIAAGCPERDLGRDLFLIPDRPTAIRKAFSLAGPGDRVMLLGKGHENSIIYANGPIPYDEIGEAERALAELGYGGQHED